MEYAHTVDFTGWGEPLLHRRIFEMVRMAKERECVTTMTSNGTALTERNGRLLIEAGLDRLAVSIDGMRPETYEAIRVGATFEQVTRRLTDFSRLIMKHSSPLELAVAFTIQESNAADLERILPWMVSVGATVLHLKQLNVLSNRPDWENSFLKYVLDSEAGSDGPLRDVEQKIGRLIAEAGNSGIRVMMHSEYPMTSLLEGRHCLATPLDSVYFSYQGQVSPCCHFGHQVSRFFAGKFYPPSSMFLGDIRVQSLEEIWESPAYRHFRQGFQSGEYPSACRTCYLLYGK
jgi:MoaA/NifB/PqqE/SkfB family radical SAM enzyme